MKIELTDVYLRNLAPPETGRREVSDAKRAGLRFRLSSTGKASWMYEKRIKGGPKRKFTLGTWPALSLSNARKIALEIEAEAAQGIDRVAVADAQRIADEKAVASRVTVLEVLDRYNELHLSGLRTGDERLRQLKQSMDGKLDLHVTDLQTRHLQAVIDGHVQRGRLVMANRIRSALRAFTSWAYQRGYLDEDVGLRLAKAAREKARERVLTLDEVRSIYSSCEDLGPLWGPLFKLLILTGQRRSEIVGLRWEEIDLQETRITKPGSQTKNGKAHITHLSLASLAALQLVQGERAGWVFTTTGKTPVSGISKVKSRLDELLGKDFEEWRIHDLRTALATALAESGESETVVDKMLNHSAVGSAPSAVARVYQRGDLLSLRANALEKWAAMVTGQDTDVAPLHHHVAKE
jgi:integrase